MALASKPFMEQRHRAKTPESDSSPASGPRSDSAERILERARALGRRASEIVQDVPELIQARRNDRALRGEMDDHCRAIGKRVIALSKRARGEDPFSRFPGILREIEAHARSEDEYRENRQRLSALRAEIRGRP